MNQKNPEYVVFATDRRDPKSFREKVLFNVAAKYDGLVHTVEAIGVDPKFRLYRMQVKA